MKALILAAGMGTRLKPLTDKIPKALVEVKGVPILYQQINCLIDNGIKEILIIAGYKSDILVKRITKKYPFVKIICNNSYNSTNNMYSTYLAKKEFYNTNFILMNGDVFFDKSVIKELLRSDYYNSIVVEKDLYNVESMKVVFNKGRIKKISKEINRNDAYGVSIDVYKFSREGSMIFFEKIQDFIEIKKKLDLWTEVALNDILPKIKFIPCLLKGKWMEIDNFEDLRKAEIIFHN